MADEQPSARGENIRHAVEQASLNRLLKIDDDIAAEDDVEFAPHRPLLQQIEGLEADSLSKGVSHPDPAIALPLDAGGIFGRYRARPIGIVETFLRNPHDIGVDVG